MRVIDLTLDFAEIVRGSRGTIEFKARFWSWLDQQREAGPLTLLLEDMERHWSSIGRAPTLEGARDLLRQITPGDYAARVARIGEVFRSVTGILPSSDVVLLAGLERPEGYSRFDRGQNTLFIGLDHPSSLAEPDHLDVILPHELCHAVRDPWPAVLADYGGESEMSHDDFVARHPFREHLVSEALATSISERARPGLADRRYVYFDEEDVLWCEAHRRPIVERILLALERDEPYGTFYAEGVVTPDSPSCCDYWFGLHFGRHALAEAGAGELLHTSASMLLDRHLASFVDRFAGPATCRVAVSSTPESATGASSAVPGEDQALDAASLPLVVRHCYEEFESRVSRRPALARRLEQSLADAVAREGLEFGGIAPAVHAFPLLLSSAEEMHLRWTTDGLLRIVERVIEMYRADREVRAFFDLPRHIEELCLLEPGFRPHVMLARFDSYWSGRRVRFLELNVNGTAGWKLAEFLGQQALLLPELGEILERHGATAQPLTSRMYEGLLAAWRQARGKRRRLPRRIAIVDWSGLMTSSEHVGLARDFTKMGVPTDVVAPSELSFNGKELRGPAGPIDLVYRRLTLLDLVERHEELGALFEAARAGAVLTVCGYASDVAHSKRLFAFLTHERWQVRFSPEDRAVIDARIPWTRMFVPGKTQFEGRQRDLRELALADRARFVLKPAEGLDGLGVLIGSETEADVWETEVRERYGGDHVLQEIVKAPLRCLLVPQGSKVEQVPRWLHLGEFVIQGQLAGFLARVSRELVLSRRSAERTLPCLVLADEDESPEQVLRPSTP